jgi:hypothetical protein
LTLFAHRGGRLVRIEYFPPDRVAEAKARFEELAHEG